VRLEHAVEGRDAVARDVFVDGGADCFDDPGDVVALVYALAFLVVTRSLVISL
jgi:hypothetical protein